MELENSHIELLEKKFFGTLNDEEIVVLNNLMKDSNFKTTAKEYLRLFQGIEDDVHADLRQKMNEWDAKSKDTKVVRMSWLKYAAVFFLIAVVASVFYFNMNSVGQIDDFYTVYPNMITTRGENNMDQLSLGLKKYDKGEYKDAILILKSSVIQNDASEFYLAQSHFALGQYKEASEVFRNQATKEILYTEAANWYWALCEVKLKGKMAKPLLKGIANNEGSYAAKAEELLLLIK